MAATLAAPERDISGGVSLALPRWQPCPCPAFPALWAVGRHVDYLTIADLDDEVRPAFTEALATVRDGTARVRRLARTNAAGLTGAGHDILATAVLEFALKVPAADFDAASAIADAERLRVLLGWSTISYTLRQWVSRRLCDGWFTNAGTEWQKRWVRIEEHAGAQPPDAFVEFACWVAVGELKHGPSYAAVSAQEIFGWVTALGSDRAARLMQQGTGDLPADVRCFSAPGVSASANDVSAAVTLSLTEQTPQAHAAALSYLARLLERTDFPRSYRINAHLPTTAHLPVTGLPSCGAHHLIAAAAAHREVWPAIERYARAAMGEHQWYTDLEDEDCAMPGTFAVFALGLADTRYADLVVEYLTLVDGEHQSLQACFVEAYVDAHGMTPEAVAYLVACAGNIQDLPHRAHYPALVANTSSLTALLATRKPRGAASGISALKANLTGDPVSEYAWRAALFAIWGDPATRDDGREVIATASAELRALYEEVFA